MDWGLMIGAAVVGLSFAALLVWRRPVFAFAQRSVAYMHEVRVEMRKVSWPSWDDLQKSTVVIIIIVFIVGATIGLMDLIFSKLLIDFLGRAFGG
ncbi:MAG: preprotein translocase subunit SecE [Gemmatimonadales bacterium]|jgi:preprotein translocase SecE subunit